MVNWQTARKLLAEVENVAVCVRIGAKLLGKKMTLVETWEADHTSTEL